MKKIKSIGLFLFVTTLAACGGSSGGSGGEEEDDSNFISGQISGWTIEGAEGQFEALAYVDDENANEITDEGEELVFSVDNYDYAKSNEGEVANFFLSLRFSEEELNYFTIDLEKKYTLNPGNGKMYVRSSTTDSYTRYDVESLAITFFQWGLPEEGGRVEVSLDLISEEGGSLSLHFETIIELEHFDTF